MEHKNNDVYDLWKLEFIIAIDKEGFMNSSTTKLRKGRYKLIIVKLLNEGESVYYSIDYTKGNKILFSKSIESSILEYHEREGMLYEITNIISLYYSIGIEFNKDLLHFNYKFIQCEENGADCYKYKKKKRNVDEFNKKIIYTFKEETYTSELEDHEISIFKINSLTII